MAEAPDCSLEHSPEEDSKGRSDAQPMSEIADRNDLLMAAAQPAAGPAEGQSLLKHHANILGQSYLTTFAGHEGRRGGSDLLAGFAAYWTGHIGVNVAGAFLQSKTHDLSRIVDPQGIHQI